MRICRSLFAYIREVVHCILQTISLVILKSASISFWFFSGSIFIMACTRLLDNMPVDLWVD